MHVMHRITDNLTSGATDGDAKKFALEPSH